MSFQRPTRAAFAKLYAAAEHASIGPDSARNRRSIDEFNLLLSGHSGKFIFRRKALYRGSISRFTNSGSPLT